MVRQGAGEAADGKPLEEVARPLSVIGKQSEAIFRPGCFAACLPPARARVLLADRLRRARKRQR